MNAFLSVHGEAPVPGMDWAQPLISLIADVHPGENIAQSVDVPPGGNEVRTYLDVACRDSTPPDSVEGALDRFEAGLPALADARPHVIEGVAVRLGMEFGLRDQAINEFRQLRASAMTLLRRPRRDTPERPEPLRVFIDDVDGEAMVLQLAPDSAHALLQGRSPPTQASLPSIRVPRDTASLMSSRRADVYLHLAPVLTGLSLEDISAKGGIEYLRRNGELLWRWPGAGGGSPGFCLSCGQHNTLAGTEQGVFRCSFCGNVQANDGLWVATLS